MVDGNHFVLINYADDEHKSVGHAMVKIDAQVQHQFLSDYADDASQKVAKHLGISPLKIRILDFSVFNDKLILIDI